MKGPILITGGAGYIGSHTVRHLGESGRQLIVLDNLDYGHPEAIVDKNVKLVIGNVGNRELVRSLFDKYKFSAVIHFAAYAYVGESVSDPLKYYWNNTAEPIALLQIMQEFACKSFVFSSTCATYGTPKSIPINEANPQNPINPYGQSKLMVEKILHDCDTAWGLKSACLRYFNASGCSEDSTIGEDHDPETHLIPRVLMAITGELKQLEVYGTDYPTPDGTCIRDYIHVEDLATAHGLALTYLENQRKSIRCNLGTGKGISVRQIIEAAETVSGKKVPVTFGPRREGDPAELIADSNYAKQTLGWEPTRSTVDHIVSSAWKWMNGPNKGRYSSETNQ